MKLLEKFSNESDWNTRDLRRLCETVIRHEGVENQDITVRHHHKNKYYYHADRIVSGTAYISWWKRIVIRVPKKIVPEGYDHEKRKLIEREATFPVKPFAQVLMHEIGHLRGLNHKDMANCGKFDTGFVEGMSVRPR